MTRSVRFTAWTSRWVTTTDKDDEALALLRAMGFPFRGEIPVIIEQNAN